MLITATQKFTRQSPRKVRLVANAVKKMPLPKAVQQLAVIERKSTMVLMKTLKQAIANAVNNHGLKFEDLSIETIQVNEGPRYRRMRAVSRGRGHEVKKRTSHVIVKLKTIDTKPLVAGKQAKLEAKPVVEAAAPAPEAKAAPKTEKKTSSTKKVSKK